MDDGPLSVGHCRDFYMHLPETTTIVGVGWGRFSVACLNVEYFWPVWEGNTLQPHRWRRCRTHTILLVSDFPFLSNTKWCRPQRKPTDGAV